MNIKNGYCYDDVLLAPKYSSVLSRGLIDLSVDLGKNIKLKIPIVSANMKSVTEIAMAKIMIGLGGLALLHRFCDIQKQVSFFKESVFDTVFNANDIDAFQHVGCSVGIHSEDRRNVNLIVEAGCKIICVDVAHGDHIGCNEMVSWIAKEYPSVLIIAGNVATYGGALRLYNSGANVIKVGVGGGSVCSTRIETGCGVPQLTALESVYKASSNRNAYKASSDRNFKVIADGGIRRAGDIVKALCFSDAVMLGNLLAGTKETPGELKTKNGVYYKEYAGSSTHRINHIEGIVAQVPYKGPAHPIIEKLLDGLRSGCSYQGASNLRQLKEDPEFIHVSSSVLKESHPHVLEINQG